MDATVRQYSDPSEFYSRTRDLMLADEARYNLHYGVVRQCCDAKQPTVPDPYFAALECGDRVEALALRTPPYAMLLSDASAEHVSAWAEAWRSEGRDLDAIHAPADTAERFVEAWTGSTGAEAVVAMRQRVHVLERVEPPRSVEGHMRLGSRGEAELLKDWWHAFCVEAGVPGTKPERPAELPALDEGRLFVWDRGGPVAMAAWARPSPRGVSIGYVYTPADLRGHGFASALVAALSQHLLDSGKQFCCLFTDLANPVSNRIYAKIGYRRAADFTLWNFTRSNA